MLSVGFLVFLTVLSVRLNAQNSPNMAHGFVADAVTGEPVPFAHVRQKGTDHGTVTQADGSFRLPIIPENSTLITLEISCIGYKSQYLEVGLPKEIGQQWQIVLSPEENTLSEVVVEGKRPDLMHVLQAVKAAFAQHFPARSGFQQAFFRSEVRLNGKCKSLAEATLQLMNGGYHHHYAKDKFRFLATDLFRYEQVRLYLPDTAWFAPFAPFYFAADVYQVPVDPVFRMLRYKKEVLHRGIWQRLPDLEITSEGTTQINGKMVYVLSAYLPAKSLRLNKRKQLFPLDDVLYRAKLFVLAETNALLRLQIEFLASQHKDKFPLFRFQNQAGYGLQWLHFQLDWEEWEGHYHLRSLAYETEWMAYHQQNTDTLKVSQQLTNERLSFLPTAMELAELQRDFPQTDQESGLIFNSGKVALPPFRPYFWKEFTKNESSLPQPCISGNAKFSTPTEQWWSF